MEIEKRTLVIGIDGGDFYPFGLINSGIKRIIDSFLRNIPQLDFYDIIINYYYFGDEKPKDSPDNLSYELRIKKLPTRLFSSVFLPYNLIKDKNNVYLGFSTVTPHFIGYFPIRKISFLYDLGFLMYPGLYANSQRMIDHTIQTIILSDVLIVLSKYAKREILKSIKDIDPRKIVVKYPGNDHVLPPKKINKVGYDYFLYVGVIKPIKDIYRLIKLYAEFRDKNKKDKTKLVLLGKKESDYWKAIIKHPEYQTYKEDIILVEGISDKELINYYMQATAIVNTSKVEGLGFPVLEALSLGKRVIVNDVPIYSEFKNKYKNLFIGYDDKQIISFMKKSTDKNTIKEKMEYFSWKEFCEKILEEAIRISP